MSERIAVIGGDKRQHYLYHLIKNTGYSVSSFGVDGICDSADSVRDTVGNSDIIVLPVPISRDCRTVNNVSEHNILLSDVFSDKRKKYIAGAVPEELLNEFNEYSIVDYSENEAFAYKNAVLTCEGAIARAVCNTDISIFQSFVLVCGFGRIGRVLSLYLKQLGADVTVSARKPAHLACIEALGMHSIVSQNIRSINEFDIIFNTIPFSILTDAELSTAKSDCLIIDLASKPGGVDFEYCKNHAINADHALSLPGIYSKKASAKIIYDFIISYIREEKI